MRLRPISGSNCCRSYHQSVTSLWESKDSQKMRGFVMIRTPFCSQKFISRLLWRLWQPTLLTFCDWSKNVTNSKRDAFFLGYYGKHAQVKIHGDMQGHSPQAWSPVIQVKDNHQKKTCGKCLKDVNKNYGFNMFQLSSTIPTVVRILCIVSLDNIKNQNTYPDSSLSLCRSASSRVPSYILHIIFLEGGLCILWVM